jgi:hypothetical protein
MNNCYKLDSLEVLRQLDTDAARGLSRDEATHRLQQYPNFAPNSSGCPLNFLRYLGEKRF